jgi:hypothetical protein
MYLLPTVVTKHGRSHCRENPAAAKQDRPWHGSHSLTCATDADKLRCNNTQYQQLAKASTSSSAVLCGPWLLQHNQHPRGPPADPHHYMRADATMPSWC